jgi:glycosyltransferase involved in cell wall biosynthesis
MPSSSEPNATPLVSIVIPIYNEAHTIERLLAVVRGIDIDKELILVDDGSDDDTRARLHEAAQRDARLRVIRHDRNLGKGAALRTGFAAARGQFVAVQDADLEYDPRELPKLLAPLLNGTADVVFGSRFAGGQPHRAAYYWHQAGNRILTGLSNLATGLKLTDVETGAKAFRRDVIHAIEIQEQGFGVEPELAAKMVALRLNGRPLRISEVAISYNGRSYREGKKIGWRDGLRALWCIVKYSWLR